jgi:tetratricopeptide (TPR) repeat protein
MTKKETLEAETLKKEILSESIKLEKLHKIWLSEYYLGLAYLINGDLKKAKIYAKKGLAMNPNPPYLWNLLHYINVKYASQKTGKPIIDFLPSKKDAESLFKSMRNIKQSLKNSSE